MNINKSIPTTTRLLSTNEWELGMASGRASMIEHVSQRYIGKYVLIRTLASGVHFGKAVSYSPEINHIILEDARRLYSYVDRFTLSEVSQQGVTDKALMSISIPDITICDVIEIMGVSNEAEKSLQEVKTHVAPGAYKYDGTDIALMV